MRFNKLLNLLQHDVKELVKFLFTGFRVKHPLRILAQFGYILGIVYHCFNPIVRNKE